MSQHSDYEVIIIGGGPAGVALGLELGMHGIHTLILEKYRAPLLSPRAQSLNARTMEFFRRWGIADALRAEILLPKDFPIRGIWCTALNDKALASSSSNELLSDDITPERGVRIPLYLTEKVLRHRLEDFPSVTLQLEQEVINVELNGDLVAVETIHGDKFTSRFAVGCDGANSITRSAVGIGFTELSAAHRVVNLMFIAPDLMDNITVGKGFLYYLLADTPGAIGPIDLERGIWYAQIRDNSTVNDVNDLDLSHLLDKMAGFTFNKEIIEAHFWHMQIKLADSFARELRIFLAGDSCHAFVPTGGFGLNTGLGDVVNLGWKLAAVIKAMAQPELLASYEIERRPICLENLRLAQKNADDLLSLRKKYNPETDPEGFAAANARLAGQYVGAFAATLGYRYGDDPDARLDSESGAKYTPITATGYFLPHRFLADGRSIYDILPADKWTLILSGITLEELDKKQRDIILKNNYHVVQLPKKTYPYTYILIRPDWHIMQVG